MIITRKVSLLILNQLVILTFCFVICWAFQVIETTRFIYMLEQGAINMLIIY